MNLQQAKRNCQSNHVPRNFFGSDPEVAPLLKSPHPLSSPVAKMCALNDVDGDDRVRAHTLDRSPSRIYLRTEEHITSPPPGSRGVFADDPIVVAERGRGGNIITPSHFRLKKDAIG